MYMLYIGLANSDAIPRIVYIIWLNKYVIKM